MSVNRVGGGGIKGDRRNTQETTYLCWDATQFYDKEDVVEVVASSPRAAAEHVARRLGEDEAPRDSEVSVAVIRKDGTSMHALQSGVMKYGHVFVFDVAVEWECTALGSLGTLPAKESSARVELCEMLGGLGHKGLIDSLDAAEGDCSICKGGG